MRVGPVNRQLFSNLPPVGLLDALNAIPVGVVALFLYPLHGVMWHVMPCNRLVWYLFNEFFHYVIIYNFIVIIIEFLVLCSALRERIELSTSGTIVGGRSGVALDSDFCMLEWTLDTASC